MLPTAKLRFRRMVMVIEAAHNQSGTPRSAGIARIMVGSFVASSSQPPASPSLLALPSVRDADPIAGNPLVALDVADRRFRATALTGRDTGELPLEHHAGELVAVSEMVVGRERHFWLAVRDPCPRSQAARASSRTPNDGMTASALCYTASRRTALNYHPPSPTRATRVPRSFIAAVVTCSSRAREEMAM